MVPVRTRQGKIGFLDIISSHKKIAFFTRMPSHPIAVWPVFDASRSHHKVPFILNRINSQQLFPASRLQFYLGRALKSLKQLLWRVLLVTLPGHGARCSGVRWRAASPAGPLSPGARGRTAESQAESHFAFGPGGHSQPIQSAVPKPLPPGSRPDSKVTLVLPDEDGVAYGGEDEPHEDAGGTGMGQQESQAMGQEEEPEAEDWQALDEGADP